MYGKFFASTFSGSMYGSGANVFALWGYIISNAVNGFVDLNPQFISPILGMSLSEVTAAIKFLCSPDASSRNKAEEGRRIIKEGQFQYRVVNHSIYRAIRNDDDRREYNRTKQREHRQRVKQHINDSQSLSAMSTMSAHTEAEAEADKKKNMGQQAGPSAEDLAFAEIQAAYPKREGSQRWKSARSSYRARIREGYTHEDIFAGVIRYSKYCETKKITRTGLVQQAATFLGTNLGFTEPWTMTDVVRRDDFKQLTDAEIVRRCRLAGIGTTGLSRQELISRLVA